MRARLPLLASLSLLPTVALAAEPAPASNVRIYRCVSASGAVALQSTPCDGTHRQQVLDMQRPQDPPPRPAAPPPATPSATIMRAWALTAWGVKNSGATTKAFFTHCCGRSNLSQGGSRR